MFYILSEDVFLVNGHAKSCIYDFRNSKLYRINNALAREIERAGKGDFADKDVQGELKKIFGYLMDEGVIMLSSQPRFSEIYDMKKEIECSFAWIEVTEKCNLKCRHCYNESNLYRESSMTFEDYKIVVDSLLKLGIKRIQIIGGEPFFIADILKEMLDYTVGKFDAIEIFTNGTMLSNEWMEYLKIANIRVALSVYSYDSEVHDKVTKCKGAWEKTNITIKKLKEYGIKYRVCNVLMRDVALGSSTTDLYTLSSEKDIVRMAGRANFLLLTDELIKKKLITKETFSHPLNKKSLCTTICGHNCFASKIYISAKLEVFPCVMERRIKHCIVSECDGIQLKKSIQELNKDHIDVCCCCEYRYACFDCRPDSLSGELLEKPWYCTYDPLLGKWQDEDEFIMHLKDKWL